MMGQQENRKQSRMSDVRFTHLVAFDMPAIICKLAPGPLQSKLSSAMVGERPLLCKFAPGASHFRRAARLLATKPHRVRRKPFRLMRSQLRLNMIERNWN